MELEPHAESPRDHNRNPRPTETDDNGSADTLTANRDGSMEQGEPFGENERRLGVATNRAMHSPGWDETPTAINYSAVGFNIAIDLEHDPSLVGFLDQVRTAVEVGDQPTPLTLAERATRQVVAQTPVEDVDGSHHTGRHTTLGEALRQPVMCIDRSLAMQAALVMFGFEGVGDLPSMVRYPDEYKNAPHVDVSFRIGDEEYVAITTGYLKGGILPIDLYVEHVRSEDRRDGGTTELQPHFSWSYFQSVG